MKLIKRKLRMARTRKAARSSKEEIKIKKKVKLDEPYSFLKEGKLLLNNKKFSDCSFLVGDEKKLIYGHKNILSMASPAFKSMFYGPIELKNNLPIEIPDLTSIGFMNMLK